MYKDGNLSSVNVPEKPLLGHYFMMQLGFPAVRVYGDQLTWVKPHECTRLICAGFYAEGLRGNCACARNWILERHRGALIHWPYYRTARGERMRTSLFHESRNPGGPVYLEAKFIRSVLEMWASNFGNDGCEWAECTCGS